MNIEQDQEFLPVENLVIIGSGPAGYTAAIYAARANLCPLLITGFQSGGIAGGQLMTTTFVENFPGFPEGVLGPDLMDLMKAQALRWGTKLIEEDADFVDLTEKPFIVKANGNEIRSHSLIIATGATAKRLGLPNEEKFWSKGISACAICDGATPQFQKETLAVVGGGDSACEEAVFLTKYGSQVHLLVRSEKLRASASLIDRVFDNPKIKVHWCSEVIDVKGKDWLEGLLIKNKKSNKEEYLSVSGLFYAIGHIPNTAFLNGQLDCDSSGFILTKSGRPETSIEGVFAAGDVADSEWKQGVTAAGSGCKAALASERWLTKNNFSKIIKREGLVHSSLEKVNLIKTTTEDDFSIKANWQKGSYALRRIYHESKNPLLVIYTSKQCGPCHVLKPQLRRVIEELDGKAQAIEIDIEEDKDIAIQAGINGTPFVQLFKSKKLYSQWKGVKQRSDFKKAIEELIDLNS